MCQSHGVLDVWYTVDCRQRSLCLGLGTDGGVQERGHSRREGLAIGHVPEQCFPFSALELTNFWDLSTHSPALHTVWSLVGTGNPCKSPKTPRTGKGVLSALCVCEALEVAKWYSEKIQLASVVGKIGVGCVLASERPAGRLL